MPHLCGRKEKAVESQQRRTRSRRHGKGVSGTVGSSQLASQHAVVGLGRQRRWRFRFFHVRQLGCCGRRSLAEINRQRIPEVAPVLQACVGINGSYLMVDGLARRPVVPEFGRPVHLRSQKGRLDVDGRPSARPRRVPGGGAQAAPQSWKLLQRSRRRALTSERWDCTPDTPGCCSSPA